MPKVSTSQAAATKRYQKAAAKNVSVKFFPPDYDLYEWLGKQDAKATYIKRLIREDMERQQKR